MVHEERVDGAGRPVSSCRVVVRTASWVADQVIAFTLESADGSDLPEWAPGAHVDLVLPSGLIRQYSLCGDPANRGEYRIAVLREEAGRGGSAEMHSTNLVGRDLELHGPRNYFRLEPAPEYLFVAGGVGITPIVQMVRTAESTGTPWRLIYGGRSRRSMAFTNELSSGRFGRIDLVPEDEFGHPDIAAAVSGLSDGALVYCCGPSGMLAAASEACERLLTKSALRLERFTKPEAATDDVASKRDPTSFEVELSRSGHCLEVPPDRSILDVVLEVLPDTLYSCEEGYCGTCETRVLDGRPEHCDTCLSEAEREAGNTMMICVSRALSRRLVLDL